MEKMLRQLETFTARGNDGRTYAVHGYEHLVRVDLMTDGREHWESTGQAEYKLADGRPVRVDSHGTLHAAGSALLLERQ